MLGNHPRTELEIKLMEGRYGPYVTDGTTNATIPKSVEPNALTLEEAVALIDVRPPLGWAALGLPLYWGNRNWHPFLADTLATMRADGLADAMDDALI